MFIQKMRKKKLNKKFILVSGCVCVCVNEP